MKKLLVLSDSHGDTQALRRCLEQDPEVDALIFLGDGCRDLDQVLSQLHRRLPAYMAKGNCDYNCEYPAEGLAVFEGQLVFYTHGYMYGVEATLGGICRTAKARGADVVLFGHTHRPLTLEMPELPRLYNPGSVSRPRGREGPTYGLLTLQRGQPPQFELKPVPPIIPPGCRDLF